MGIATYNRGSKVIRDRLDREAEERRTTVINHAVSPDCCEWCHQPFRGIYGGPLGLREQTWSERRGKWVDACRTCRSFILRNHL